jgi:hypothetical protein
MNLRSRKIGDRGEEDIAEELPSGKKQDQLC